MLRSAEVTPQDGRVARSHRTRLAIVDALIALLEEGNVQPTIEEVAVRAGVAPRTVFQHYADREALFAAVSARRGAELDALMGDLPERGPLEPRIAAVVAQRARVYEWIAPVRRAALLMEPFSPSVHDALEGLRVIKRSQLSRLFATELEPLAEEDRAAVEAALGAVASFSAWDALRTQQGLSVAGASAALHRTLRGLLLAG